MLIVRSWKHCASAWHDADLVDPEVEPTRIAVAAEKVQVLLPHKEVLFQCRIPAQLAADLAIGKVVAVHVLVMQAGLQIRHLLRRRADLQNYVIGLIGGASGNRIGAITPGAPLP